MNWTLSVRLRTWKSSQNYLHIFLSLRYGYKGALYIIICGIRILALVEILILWFCALNIIVVDTFTCLIVQKPSLIFYVITQ